MKKLINLAAILESKRNEAYYIPAMDYVAEAMKEACKQTLELAAENAQWSRIEDCDPLTGFSYDSIQVNKQSILNTINQIE